MELLNGKLCKAKVVVSKSAYKKLLEIAKKNYLLGHNGRENLDTHNWDSQDFYEVAVWSINDALQEAYQLGLADGRREYAKS